MASEGETSEVIRERVDKARKIQLERYKDIRIYSNSQLQPAMLGKFCKLDEKGRNILKNAFEKLGIECQSTQPDT